MRRLVVGGFAALTLLVPASAASANPTIGDCDADPDRIIIEVHNEDGPAGDWHVCLNKP